MPGLGPLLDEENADETAKLWLPSELSEDEQLGWCLPGVPALEFRFRYAQADDSLAEIRRLRRMLQGVRDQNLKHPSLVQKSITRTKGLFESFQAKIRRVVSRYRDSYKAMMALDPSQQLKPGWMNRFQKLEDAHVCGPGREPDDVSNGRYIPSWIWLVPRLTTTTTTTTTPTTANPQGPDATANSSDPCVPATNNPPGPGATTNPSDSGAPTANDPTGSDTTTAADCPTTAVVNNPEVVESMRVHWAKCQARADRYEEEVALTVEEMGRTLRYFEWKKSDWLSLQSAREKSHSPPPVEICRGLRAYAARQARVYEDLKTSFVKRWRKVLMPHKLGSEWLCRYPAAADPPTPKKSRVRSQPVAPEPIPSPAGSPPPQVNPLPFSLPVLLIDDSAETDAPMDSGTETDNDDNRDDDDDDDWIDEDDQFDFDD
jgi:hypothetical protein